MFFDSFAKKQFCANQLTPSPTKNFFISDKKLADKEAKLTTQPSELKKNGLNQNNFTTHKKRFNNSE